MDTNRGKALGQMIKNNQSLQELKLSDVVLTKNVVRELVTALQSSANNSSFHQLELKNVSFSYQDGISDMLNAIANNKSLISFHMDDCNLDESNGGAEGIANILTMNTNLIELSVCNNSLNGECINIIANEGLKLNNTLRQLYLNNNPIGDDGAVFLTNVLQINNTLKELHLENSEIWSDGCEYFSRGLANMRGLRKLILDGNDFVYNDECINIIEQSLKKNMMITRLFHTMSRLLEDNNPEKKKQWIMIDLHLRLNRANRRILIEPNVPQSLWTKVFEKANGEPDTLHVLLRNAPQLFCR